MRNLAASAWVPWNDCSHGEGTLGCSARPPQLNQLTAHLSCHHVRDSFQLFSPLTLQPLETIPPPPAMRTAQLSPVSPQRT